MVSNADLGKAKSNKNDEFYTQLADIEAEMRHYTHHFRGSAVYCNCDDPTRSAFWEYFHANFDALGLRKLISTHYEDHGPTYVMSYEGGDDGDIGAGTVGPLAGNGDFRSDECVRLLDECDIVVTNPPFSLFREYVAQLMDHGKKFLIIGNVNAVTYKDFFPLVRDDKVWFGPSIHSGDRKFNVPDDYPLDAAGCGIDGNGRKFIRVKGVRWFTNLDHGKRHEKLVLHERYVPGKYPKYDGYDAINVDSVTGTASKPGIPCDYDGVMGVPITFLDKYCPDQFEIVGIDRYVSDNPRPGRRFTLSGKEVYARLLVRMK